VFCCGLFEDVPAVVTALFLAFCCALSLFSRDVNVVMALWHRVWCRTEDMGGD